MSERKGEGALLAGEAVPQSWRAVLAPVMAGTGTRRLDDFLRAEEQAGRAVYPPAGTRLAALALTALEDVRVVILGQDPYHGLGQAHGLAFSVLPGVKVPPSLANIYKELEADLGIPRPRHGNLTAWARQGVLLLNSALTVEAGRAGTHATAGWEPVTDALLAAVAARETPSVFILWGNHARRKAERVPAITAGRHLVLTSAHPSPLSARTGFFGSRPFSQANAFLGSRERGVVDWTV